MKNTNIYLKPESSFKFYFYDWTEYIRDEAAGEYWTLMKKGGDDGDIRFIPGDQGLGEGYYTVRVDLNTLKVTLTGGTAPSYPETLFLFGPATEAGWDLGNFIPLTKTSNGVFQVKGVNIDVGTANPDDNKGNGFKFGGFEQRMEYRIRRQGGFRRPRRTTGLPRLGTCAKQQSVLSPC